MTYRVILVSALFVLGPLVQADAARAPRPAPTAPQGKAVAFTLKYRISAPGQTQSASLVVALPPTLALRQQIDRIDYSISPARVWQSGPNQYAEFRIDRPTGQTDLTIHVRARLFEYDLATASHRAQAPAPAAAPTATPDPWLVPEPYLESDSPAIRTLAARIHAPNPLQRVRQALTIVLNTMRYSGYNPEDIGALEALHRRKGDCTDFSDLLVAICRCESVPARVIDGYVAARTSTVSSHNWVEFYHAPLGWVPLDPLWCKLRQASFDRMPNVYIYISQLRNDPALDNHHFWNCRYQGDPIQVEHTFSFVAD